MYVSFFFFFFNWNIACNKSHIGKIAFARNVIRTKNLYLL